MNSKKLSLVLFIACLFSSSFVWGQRPIYEDTELEAGEIYVCAFGTVQLHEYPGQTVRSIGTILFTEEVEHLGREAFVRGENNDYLRVRTEEGAIGWVRSAYFVKGGGTVVVLENAPIYKKRGSPQTATTDFFQAGELVILSEFAEGWVKLTGKALKKSGWVKGYHTISAEDSDIEMASRLDEIMNENDPGKRRNKLLTLRDGRGGGYLSGEMRGAIDQAIANTYPQPDRGQPAFPPITNVEPEIPLYPGGEDDLGQPNPNRDYYPGTLYPAPTPGYPGSPPATPNYVEREVVDMQTGRSYIQVIETGTVQPVKAKKPKNIYYAYHKTLPEGSKLLLSVPGTDKYVQLEVIAPLKSTNPNVVGLGPEVIKKVFGVSTAKEIVGAATIRYPKGY